MTFPARNLSVGEHPSQEPDLSGPCVDCIAESARNAVRDAYDDLVGKDAFPKDDERDFRDRFGPLWNDMEQWLADRAREAALRRDHDYCYDHRPQPDDED